jgi:hypothetical protein
VNGVCIEAATLTASPSKHQQLDETLKLSYSHAESGEVWGSAQPTIAIFINPTANGGRCLHDPRHRSLNNPTKTKCTCP